MPKQPRTSVSSPGRPSKVSRRWQPAVDLVAHSSKGLPKSCVMMVNAAIPHVFADSKDARHSFQNQVVEDLIKLGVDHEEALKASVVAVEAELKAFAEEKEEFGEKHGAAKADLEEKVKDKAEKEALSATAQAAVTAAEEEQAKQVAKVGAAEEELKSAAKKKLEFEEIVVQWEALKGCTYDKKDWRARNKTIKVVVDSLQLANAPASLLSSLPTVLKDSAERSPFAQIVVEHTEAAIKEHLAKATSTIEELEGAVTEHKTGAATAEEATKKAKEDADAAMQAAIDSENVWVGAADKVFNLEKAQAGFDTREGALAGDLDKANRDAEIFAAIRAKVQNLVDDIEEPAPAETPKSARGSTAAVSPELPVAQD